MELKKDPMPLPANAPINAVGSAAAASPGDSKPACANARLSPVLPAPSNLAAVSLPNNCASIGAKLAKLAGLKPVSPLGANSDAAPLESGVPPKGIGLAESPPNEKSLGNVLGPISGELVGMPPPGPRSPVEPPGVVSGLPKP